MLMHDINLLLPSAIRTMRSSLRDVSRQQIPFTVEGLARQGLPEKFASALKESAPSLGGERLVVARFIADLFAMNHEDYAARESLRRWLAAHEGEHAEALRAKVLEVLRAWSDDEFGPGESESLAANLTEDEKARAQSSARSFIYRMF